MLIEVNRTEEEGKKEYKVTPKVSVQENKAVTVDVSEYTEPVEILPPEGKVAMEKVTLTLDNIPSGGSLSTEVPSWISDVTYLPEEVLPVGVKVIVAGYINGNPTAPYAIIGDGTKLISDFFPGTNGEYMFISSCGNDISIYVNLNSVEEG